VVPTQKFVLDHTQTLALDVNVRKLNHMGLRDRLGTASSRPNRDEQRYLGP
jgi:hypothetical protein